MSTLSGMKDTPSVWKRARRVVAGALIVVAGALAAPSIAFAEEGPVGAVVQQGDSSAITLTPMHWTILTGLVTPFVVGLLTKASRSAWFKGLVGIIVATVAALIERATLADGSGVLTAGALVDTLMVYAPQLLTYLGVWQHLDNGAGLNSKLAPNAGI